MTEEEKRAYQAAWESIKKRGEGLTYWTPTITEEERAERERMIESGELPF